MEKRDTDFGFVLVDDDAVELYGQTGMGRFELFAGCEVDTDENVEELLDSLIDSMEFEADLEVYRQTKRAVSLVNRFPRTSDIRVNEKLAGALAAYLVDNSKWFLHEPLPNGVHEFLVKQEDVQAVSAYIDRLTSTGMEEQ